MTHRGMESVEMKECIDACRECADSCLETVNHCLGEGTEHSERKHIVLLQTCSEICETAARTMLLGSEHHAEICSTCAFICEACAEDCETFKDDEDMKACAEICRKCAESCRAMVGQNQGRQKDYRKSSPTQSASV